MRSTHSKDFKIRDDIYLFIFAAHILVMFYIFTVHGMIGSCMDMEKCIANCGGSYEIGPLGPDGCQSCTCNPE
jgi:hypothetical protein